MKLRAWRQKHKLSQEQAASLLHMKRTGIQEAEKPAQTRELIQLAMRYLDLMLDESPERAAYLLRKYRKTWHKNNN